MVYRVNTSLPGCSSFGNVHRPADEGVGGRGAAEAMAPHQRPPVRAQPPARQRRHRHGRGRERRARSMASTARWGIEADRRGRPCRLGRRLAQPPTPHRVDTPTVRWEPPPAPSTRRPRTAVVVAPTEGSPSRAPPDPASRCLPHPAPHRPRPACRSPALPRCPRGRDPLPLLAARPLPRPRRPAQKGHCGHTSHPRLPLPALRRQAHRAAQAGPSVLLLRVAGPPRRIPVTHGKRPAAATCLSVVHLRPTASERHESIEKTAASTVETAGRDSLRPHTCLQANANLTSEDGEPPRTAADGTAPARTPPAHLGRSGSKTGRQLAGAAGSGGPSRGPYPTPLRSLVAMTMASSRACS